MRYSPRKSLLVFLLLTGCTKDAPMPDTTRAWLHQTDGEQLIFRNPATGTTTPLQVSLKRTEYSYGSKSSFGTGHSEFYNLSYFSSTQEAYGLEAVFKNRMLSVTSHGYAGYPAKLEINVTDHTGKFYDEATPPARLVADTVINGHSHAQVLQGGFNPDTVYRPYEARTRIRRFWYAKDAGLVAYREKNGQLWYRVW
ncbi:hypothetical protein HMJ29_00495 [Hymenobacter taeanensis]|uniref:Uncharacterized protein n=1 Tax=Hymenobacter taeanensis TaxID=2735321 RepID=A0A6M6BB43_9BACT|nr:MULTISPECIES: hypothetical protein [Hymenobacter]QJX45496.1 hypothetical protein HMJ29_00495 [Hymenobacter taeanensis]UOQ81257.1 hypothetical protein MUN83_00190 [Hymenobacter sp. 5414T-23]